MSLMEREGFEVKHLCETLGVCRSAYYHYQNRPPSQRQQLTVKLKPLIQRVFSEHRRRYGSRRIAKQLTAEGEACGRTKTRKIMAEMGLAAIQPRSFKPRTTQSRHTLGYNPNLLIEKLELTRLNQLWVGDITYIPLTSQFGYLAMLMDLFSRKIIGWSLERHMREPLAIAALTLAIRSRQPDPKLIHHTDRGGQYAGTKYRKILKRAQIQQSMSRAGDCYDNAFMESCFGTIKTELEMTNYNSFHEATREIRDYINYYNAVRRHSSLDYQSPINFEKSTVP